MAVERKFIEDSILRFRIAKFLKDELSHAGFSKLTIQKTPVLTMITAEVTNPGRVIGRRGRKINELTEQIRKRFGIDNPKINIAPVSVPELEPFVMAHRIARLIETGRNPRRVLHNSVRQIMDAGAVGCEIVIGGKLAAKGGRAKSIRAIAGYLPKAGEPARWVKVAHVTAYPKPGAIGVLVKIAPPDVHFPDKVEEKAEEVKVEEVEKAEEEKEKVETEKKEAKEKTEEMGKKGSEEAEKAEEKTEKEEPKKKATKRKKSTTSTKKKGKTKK